MKPLHTLALTCVFCGIFLIYALYYNYKKQELDSKSDVMPKSQDLKQDSKALLDSIMQKYSDKKPTLWAENPPGSINSIESKGQKVLYLTLDACGGEYDSKLIDFLSQNNIKATLFINARWIKNHTKEFYQIAQNPLFSIQNHGTNHKPLSVNGASIYGIKGTKSVAEVFAEIDENDKLITQLSGKKAHFFRSGSAFYDDVAMDIAKDMGYKIAGFNVVGDGGATYSLQKILKIGKKVESGDILIYHFNKPQSSTRQGLEILIPKWLEQGFSFGLLE